eukprot:3104091-Rhodomonas_salina.1
MALGCGGRSERGNFVSCFFPDFVLDCREFVPPVVTYERCDSRGVAAFCIPTDVGDEFVCNAREFSSTS